METKPPYDLEERTFQFAKAVRLYLKKLPKTISNLEDGRQVIRSSASTGANYIEANESLGKKDFLMRLKISRKESKETAFFIRLLVETNHPEFQPEGVQMHNEAIQLKKILTSIIEKSK
jgi:four helix bundle protein